jgi:AAA lid domain
VRDATFGNAPLVRNLFEDATRAQANRLESGLLTLKGCDDLKRLTFRTLREAAVRRAAGGCAFVRAAQRVAARSCSPVVDASPLARA